MVTRKAARAGAGTFWSDQTTLFLGYTAVRKLGVSQSLLLEDVNN